MTEISPEVQKALEEQKKNCIFCKIIKGEIASKKIFENNLVTAILDINPACRGHVLLMPKEHYPIMPFLPHETFKNVFEAAKDLCQSVKKGIVALGATIFIANGLAAGQQSQHFMIHIIPRDQEDSLRLSDLSKKEIDENKIEEAFKLISQNLLIMVENHLKKHPQEWHTPANVAASPQLSKEKVIQIVEQNSQLKDMIISQPSEFLRQAKVHDQLKRIFSSVDPKEIIEHFLPGGTDKIKDAEIIEEKETKKDETEKKSDEIDEDTSKSSGSKNETDKDVDSEDKVSMNDIAQLFK